MRLLLTAFLSFLILFSGQFQIIDIHQNTKSTELSESNEVNKY